MADWSLPTTSSDYLTGVLPQVDGRLDDAAQMFFSSPSNQPAHTVRLVRSSNLGHFEEWDGVSSWVTQVLTIAGGGTGATTASGARTNLGLGSISTQDASAVAITGGTIAGTAIDNTNSIDAAAITSGTIASARLPSTFFAGMVLMYGGSSSPSGWLFCDGSAVSRTTYSVLFGVIGTAYGAGNGTTTFNVPDFQGRTPIGVGSGSGLTPRARGDSLGEEAHQLTLSESPAHQHNVTFSSNRSQNVVLGSSDNFDGTTGSQTTDSQGGNGTHNNMQPSLAINFIIKT